MAGRALLGDPRPRAGIPSRVGGGRAEHRAEEPPSRGSYLDLVGVAVPTMEEGKRPIADREGKARCDSQDRSRRRASTGSSRRSVYP